VPEQKLPAEQKLLAEQKLPMSRPDSRAVSVPGAGTVVLRLKGVVAAAT